MLTLKASEFVTAVSSVIAAASDDKTTPVLCGVHITWDASGTHFVATNRYVLSVQHVTTGADTPGSVTVPVDTLKAALAVCKANPHGTLDLAAVGPWESGTVAGVTFTNPGEYPAWQNLAELASPAVDGIAAFGACPLQIAKLAAPKVKGRTPALRFDFGISAQKAIRVTRVGDDTWHGLLMPVRLES